MGATPLKGGVALFMCELSIMSETLGVCTVSYKNYTKSACSNHKNSIQYGAKFVA